MAIRKDPGHYNGPHPYSVSKSLDGETPGRRTIVKLQVRRLDGAKTREGLAPLAAFGDIEVLELDRVSRVDLAPLAALARLRLLTLNHLEGVDLEPLSHVGSLENLTVVRFADCPVPDRLTLPAGLLGLTIVNDGAGYTGEPVRALVSAIDWSGLPALQALLIEVGGLEPIAPIEVDLGFLRLLPRLRHLRIEMGVRHRGPGPSPLEPPFDGLPPSLEQIQIDAWDPEPVAAALQARFPDAVRSVFQRYGPEPSSASWTVHPPDGEDDTWSTYGSLADAFGGTSEDTETAALRRARRKLKAADPALLGRLDFDPESSGTGITAPSRADLEAALAILGIEPGG